MIKSLNLEISGKICSSGACLKSNDQPCTSDSQCPSGLYCTPLSLGERHCCNTGQKWGFDEITGKWKCTENTNCNLGLINCLKGKTTIIGVFSCFGLSPCSSGEVCCNMNYGTPTPDCVLPSKCIKPY